MVLAQDILAAPCLNDYAFAYDTGDGSFGLAGSGALGSVVEVQIVDSSGVRHTQNVTIGGDGKFVLNGNAPGGLTNDDEVRILCDGGLHETLVLSRP